LKTLHIDNVALIVDRKMILDDVTAKRSETCIGRLRSLTRFAKIEFALELVQRHG
jgi:hypothetical protein